MGSINSSYVTVNPSYIMPETIMQQNQVSGAFDLLYTGQPLVRLGQEDLYVYVKAMDIRTRVHVGQSATNNLPSVSISNSMVSTPSYLIRVRAEYDHHDTAAAGNWGYGLPQAYRLGMRQGIFSQMRSMLLYGRNPANGEGLLNTPGATAVSLPADSNGNTTVATYDNGQMAFFLLQQINAVKTRTNQLGQGVRVTITGPQRVLGAFEYQNIVQLTQFQREGGGVASTAGVVKNVLDWNDDTLEWTYDDTLIGKGAGGTDAIIVTVAEIEVPKGTMGGGINTNEFAKLTPNLGACNLMLCDMAAPRELPAPLPAGAIDVTSELRCTSGWGLRPEVITILSMQYQ